MLNKLKGVWLKNQIYKQIIWDAMNIDPLMKSGVQDLSGGEMQRVGLAVALGRKADLYLIDEPSAYLDVE